MKHIVLFTASIFWIVAYLVGTYNYWLKKDKHRDKSDAVFMTLVTSVGIIVCIPIVCILWSLTR